MYYCLQKIYKNKGMSVNKFYNDVDTSELTEKELNILNERKQMLF